MKLFKRKWQYTQEEIAEQIGQIGDLMKMRKSSQVKDEAAKFTYAIEVSQEVLAFMLDENKGSQSH